MTTANAPQIDVIGDVTDDQLDALADLLLAIVEADEDGGGQGDGAEE